MQKMKTVFKIDRTIHRAINEPVEETKWVIDGEGVATLKRDGTSVMISDGKLFKRYDCKKGRTPPNGFQPCDPSPDPVTGHWPGWIEVGDEPESKYHREAFDSSLPDGTYELVGPKIQGNRYGLSTHTLIRHGSEIIDVKPTWDSILEWLSAHDEEGLVFHHPDGRMAKIRRKDFGLKW